MAIVGKATKNAAAKIVRAFLDISFRVDGGYSN
jgi:hypothetical protein